MKHKKNLTQPFINMKNKIKVRQYRSNQGRDPKQQSGNELAAFVSVLGLVITFVIITLIGYFN